MILSFIKKEGKSKGINIEELYKKLTNYQLGPLKKSLFSR